MSRHSVQSDIAGNRATPTRILAYYAAHADWRLRWSVANNRGVTNQLLRQLYIDRNKSVRRSVVLNPSVPDDILEHAELYDVACSVQAYAKRALMRRRTNSTHTED